MAATTFQLQNEYLTRQDDHLYHLGLSSEDDVIKRMGDVKV